MTSPLPRRLRFSNVVLLLFLSFPLLMNGAASENTAQNTQTISALPAYLIPLSGPAACHTQGLAVAGKHLFVSCVETRKKRAILYRYDLPARFPQILAPLTAEKFVDLTQGAMYHPSGLDYDGHCLWAAVAHYRKYGARSRLMCLDPETMRENFSWEINDHIGAVAGMEGEVAALNWDARDIYLFSAGGREFFQSPAPRAVAYQDCKGSASRVLMCCGPVKFEGRWGARVDVLAAETGSPPVFRLRKSLAVITPEVSLGREGFGLFRGERTFLVFLPEDFPDARLYLFPLPEDFP